MALLNEGKLPDAVGAFEKYLKLAPDRPVRRAGQGDGRAAEEVDAGRMLTGADRSRQVRQVPIGLRD